MVVKNFFMTSAKHSFEYVAMLLAWLRKASPACVNTVNGLLKSDFAKAF